MAFTSAASEPDERRESDSLFKIEDFSPKKGRIALSLSFAYNTRDQQEINIGTIAAPLFSGLVIILPEISASNEKRDTLTSRVGLRYGIGGGFNLNLGFSANARRTLTLDQQTNTSHTKSRAGWRSLTAGADYRLTTYYDTPFMLLFANLTLAEKHGNKTLHGKTGMLGISSHWAFDPVLLSLTGTYSHFAPRTVAGIRLDYGEMLGISASFGFAVNPAISFRWGISQSFRGKNKVHGITSSEWTGITALTLGYTHRLTQKLVLNISAQAGVAGNETANIVTGFTWRP